MKTKVKQKRLKQSSRNWVSRQINDPYVSLAKKEGYRSRSAYKLIEIQEKFKIIKKDSIIIDLGAAPGGWSQVASQISSNIIAVDLLDIAPIQNVEFIKGDFLEPNIQEQLSLRKADLIMSDMSPNTCGIKKVDHLRIINLVENVFAFARQNLKNEGTIIAKVFQGGTENFLLSCLKQEFKKITHMKPKASRKESSEIYIIAQSFKPKTLLCYTQP
ncbi:MAG: RlmE family RNA methyltransferase [Holosporales bacterium]|nr:RlmE family RNA methyltransferase [Holosporales bacterium]